VQREGSKNKMQRRKRQEDRRSRVSVPKNEVRNTCGFVVRIHIGRHASAEIKAKLRELSLLKKYDARFIRLDEESIGIFLQMLLNSDNFNILCSAIKAL
jgi:hypothetical protein